MELSAVHPANRITTGTKTAGIKDQTFLAVTIILFRTIGFEDRFGAQLRTVPRNRCSR